MNIGVFGFYNLFGPAAVAGFLFWGIFSITMHELAHGWAALWQGDDTPRIRGRMTLNPVVHMGWISILMLAVTGIAWGMMPTDPSKYRWGRRGRIIVSGAGPLMNVLLWTICWSGFGVVLARHGDLLATMTAENLQEFFERTFPEERPRAIAMFLYIGGSLNGMLALFNLLPVPPFDGASVVAGFSRTYYRWMHDPRIANAGFLIALVALFSGIGGWLGSWATDKGLHLAVRVMGAVG